MGPGKSVHYEGVFTNQGCSLREVSLYAQKAHQVGYQTLVFV